MPPPTPSSRAAQRRGDPALEALDGKIDRIAREITLEGDLDDQARAKLIEIADKCPVHRTLHSEILIETMLKA